MCHDDRRSFEFPFQLAHEPRLARFMEFNGVLGRKSSPTIMDRGEVFHQPLRTSPSEPGLPTTVQIEVGPKRTPQEPNAVEFEFVVVQDVDVGRCDCLEFVRQSDVVIIELMVSRHIDYRHSRIAASRPFDAAQPNTNIAGENHDIGVGFRRRKVGEFSMQVAKYVKLHFWPSDPNRVTLTPASSAIANRSVRPVLDHGRWRVQFIEYSHHFLREKAHMHKIRQKLSPADVSGLTAFLCSSNRPNESLSFHELQGFLFAIASSPETIPPSEWMPVISGDEDLSFEDESEAQQVLNWIMTLYNEVNSSVLERSDTLPFGCKFKTDIFANFDERASILQWSRGFTIGYDWLIEVWDEYLPESLDEECGANVMALSFFSSRQLAEAFYAEIDHSESSEPEKSFEQFAEAIRGLFPAALSAYAHLGKTIFEVRMQEAAKGTQPARRTKVGRNDPCPCGSGKKYKKCCAEKLH